MALGLMLSEAGAQQAVARGQKPVNRPQDRPSSSPEKDINDTTVGVISGTVSGTYIQFASDLSAVLDQPGQLRVLAILGKGSLQNIDDILYVRGVDIGIVQSDVLPYLERNNKLSATQSKLQYISKLYNEEFHLLAGNGIDKIEDLAGKKVNFGLEGSGFAVTASNVFDLLNIKVTPVYDDPALAIEKLKKGEISATVGVYGKPARAYAGLKEKDGVHFVPLPYSPVLAKIYYPSILRNKDYPDLIQPDQAVETIAVGSIMVVYGWPKGSWRYNKVARFVDAFFSHIEDFQKAPRHPKWQEVNLSAPVPSWTRFPAAEEWLKKAATPVQGQAKADEPQQAAAPQDNGATLEAFRQFLKQKGDQQLTAEEQEARQRLLKQFQEWQQKKTQ
jgi:TRAP transporter TAXI family solute receptor